VALPLIALGFAAARVLGQRALMGRLASTVARRALLAGRASGARAVYKKPLPFLAPVFGPDFGWYPIPDIFTPPAYAAPAVAKSYDLTGWTFFTGTCGSAVGMNRTTPGANTSCGFNRSVGISDWNAGQDQLFITGGSVLARFWDTDLGESGSNHLYKAGPSYRMSLTDWNAAGQPTPLRPAEPAVAVPLYYAGKIAPNYPARTLSNALRAYAPQLLPIQNYTAPPVSMPYKAIVPARKLYPYMPGAPFFEQPSAPPSPRPSRPSEVPLEQPRSEYPARAVPLAVGHMRRPPIRGREKEVKARMLASLAPIKAFGGSVTEALDLLDVFYKALPTAKMPRYNGTRFAWKNPPPQVKARAVYDNFSSIDAFSVLKGYLQNEIEDAIIGRVARGVQRNFKAANPDRPIGWLAGPAL